MSGERMQKIIDEFIERLESALDESSREDWTSLYNEVSSVCQGYVPGIRTPWERVPDAMDQDLRELRGKLCMFAASEYHDPSLVPSTSINIAANAQSSATTTVTLPQTFDAIDRGTLSDEDKEEVKRDLSHAEAMSRFGRLPEFAAMVVSACEKAGKCSTSLTAVLTFLAELAKQIPKDGSGTSPKPPI